MDKKKEKKTEEQERIPCLYGVETESGEMWPFLMTEEQYDYYQALLEKKKRSKE